MEVKSENLCFRIDANEKNNCSKFVKYSKRKKNLERLICFSGLNISLKPGTCTAIVGSPFECKNVLHTIALRQTDGYLSGSLTFDGINRVNGLYRDIAYIACEDNIHFERLRVFEVLYFSARLRLVLRDVECRERAREAARVLDLDGSSFISRLNDCERRLFAIAMELVGNPSLICLHNPTAGLDASAAHEVCRCLQKIARRQNSPTTILYTVRLVQCIELYCSAIE
jgi:ABC-type multidrug transport system ATPase subunit